MSEKTTIQKPTKSDWEQNADKLQQNEQKEYEQLNTQARYNFNKKQYQNKHKQKTTPKTNPTLFD